MEDNKNKARYYVDAFARELVRAEDRDPIAPPERYYEYCKGTFDEVVVETNLLGDSIAHAKSNNSRGL